MKDRHPEKNLMLDDPDKHLKPLKTLLKRLKPRQYQEQCLPPWLVSCTCPLLSLPLVKGSYQHLHDSKSAQVPLCFQRFVKILH